MRLLLIPLDEDNLAQLEHNAQANLRVGSAESREFHTMIVGLLEQTRTFQETVGAVPPWVSYLGMEAQSGGLVGIGSFKGAPNKAGEVEIAYLTFELFRGQGCATAMVAELLHIAVEEGVHHVVAHTRRENNASTHVLECNGFRLAGEVELEEDGLVWRWERHYDHSNLSFHRAG